MQQHNNFPSDPGDTWLSDPDVMVFASEQALAVGQSAEHAFGDGIRNLLGRHKEQVRDDWDKVLGQMQYLLASAATVVAGYELDEVTFELGFSAQGKIVFVASGEVSTTISATFRKSKP